jgi:phage shock protein E
MNFISKYKANISGIIIGAFFGYAYFHYIGCKSGTCLITSKPINSTLYGAFLGNIIIEFFNSKK